MWNFSFPEKKLYYEVNVGGIRYLNISRKIPNKQPADTAEIEFLIKNNPIGFAKDADCKIE